MKIRKSASLCLSATLIGGAIAGCHRLPTPASPTEGQASPKPFTFEIVPRHSQGLTDVETIVGDGKSIRIIRNQLGIRVSTKEEVEKLVSEFGGRILEREAIPKYATANPIGIRIDTIVGENKSKQHSEQPIEIQNTNDYLLYVPTSESDDLSDLPNEASRAGFGGHFVFSSRGAASLAKRVFQLRNRTKGLVGFNQVRQPVYVSNEGMGSQSPSNGDFWWTRSKYETGLAGARINQQNGPAVWDYGTGNDIRVAVVDSGFLGQYENFVPGQIITRMETRWNVTNSSSNIAGYTGSSDAWHGRKVSSLIFAGANNGNGTLGTARDANPYIIHCNENTWDYHVAIDAARSWNAKVINLSHGSPSWCNYWCDYEYWSIPSAYNEGRILIAGSGNGSEASYPASYPEVMAIGAYDYNGNIAPGTSVSNVDLFAPGQSVVVGTNPGSSPDNYQNASGTSFSTPMVSGVAAVCALRYPGSFVNTASAISFLTRYGYFINGRISLDAVFAAE